MKTKIMKCLALVLAMTCILCFPTPASATAQGTDGTELEVVQPEKLEIQLGESWAGVAFELKTDAGMYPGVIPVGEDGILRLEIGGSTSYILTCMNSEVEIPEPDAAQHTEGVSEVENTADTIPTEDTESAAYPEESTAPVKADMADGTVSGIPVAHRKPETSGRRFWPASLPCPLRMCLSAVRKRNRRPECNRRHNRQMIAHG